MFILYFARTTQGVLSDEDIHMITTLMYIKYICASQ